LANLLLFRERRLARLAKKGRVRQSLHNSPVRDLTIESLLVDARPRASCACGGAYHWCRRRPADRGSTQGAPFRDPLEPCCVGLREKSSTVQQGGKDQRGGWNR